MKILMIVAHQDDEFFIASRISYELKQGHQFKVVYMTDGGGHGSASETRNRESLAALQSMGIADENVYFLGSVHGLKDGSLFKNMPLAFDHLSQLLQGQNFDQMFLPAWEGGHPDHDACHLIGLRWARMNSVPSVREFSLYNSFATHFLRVASLIPRPGQPLIERKLSISEAWTAFSVMRFYRSQIRTWLGLGIPALISILFSRRERLREVSLNQRITRPHEGPLMYEKVFKVHYSEFESMTGPFTTASVGSPQQSGL